MFNRKKLQLFIVCFAFFISCLLKAEEKKIGISSYEIISPDNQAYLQKVVRTTILNNFKEKESYTTLDLSSSAKDSKEKNFSQILKKEKLDALVTGSLLKVGSRFEINSEIYFSNWSEAAMTFSDSAESIDALLPVLKSHVEKLSLQINKMINRKISITPRAKPEVPVDSSVKQTSPSLSTDVTVKRGRKREPVEIRDYQWISEQLPYEGRGMVYSDLDQDGQKELVLIGLQRVYVYHFAQNKKLQLIATYQGDSQDHFIRAYAIDLNEDKKPELVISNIRKTQASSMVLEFSQKNFNPIVTRSPWIVKVLPWQGKEILLGETFTGREVNYHNIQKLQLSGDKLVEAGEFEIPHEIGIYGLMQFPFDQEHPNGLAYLSPSGSLKLYEINDSKFKKKASSSESYGGTTNFLRLERRNILNEVEDDFTYINLDPAPWLDENGRGSVIVAKNDTFLRNMIGTRPISKSSYFVKLKWEEIGLREAWVTRKIEGAILDYQIVQFPGETASKLLAVFWLRDPGFSGTMGKFNSVVAIYDLD